MATTYDADFYSWALEQADLARARSTNAIDWDNVAEELRLLGVSEERELESRFVVLLTHLLKWVHQPERRSRSWRNTIETQRRALEKHLRRNPGLKRIEHDEFIDAYALARLSASTETDLPLETFPEEPLFSLSEAKDRSWLPE